VEDFKPKFLAKTTMARKAADAAIGAAKRALTEMAAKHGRTSYWPEWGGAVDKEDPGTTMALLSDSLTG
jgi:hypothetical protein